MTRRRNRAERREAYRLLLERLGSIRHLLANPGFDDRDRVLAFELVEACRSLLGVCPPPDLSATAFMPEPPVLATGCTFCQSMGDDCGGPHGGTS